MTNHLGEISTEDEGRPTLARLDYHRNPQNQTRICESNIIESVF
ncbi:hypothetical protein BN903_59 [Halorubrum sp. AJ67]|nr:hypothetical protein BN903_59 [Halorubrum sp. AJ67]